MIKIVIVRVYYTIRFYFSLFCHFWASFIIFLNYIVWLRITDEGSVPEMSMWSIVLIKYDLKWWLHLSRSLFLYWRAYLNVSALKYLETFNREILCISSDLKSIKAIKDRKRISNVDVDVFALFLIFLSYHLTSWTGSAISNSRKNLVLIVTIRSNTWFWRGYLL